MPEHPLSGQLHYPGHGYPMPDRAGAQANSDQLSAWQRLCRGQPLGKKTVTRFIASEGGQDAPVSILQVQGHDGDALNLTLTLATPRVIPVTFADIPEDLQRASGEIDNDVALGLGNFPGTGAPLRWPPMNAIVEWGIGGGGEKAEVDMINGCTVNLCTSFLRVRAAIGGELNDGTTGTDAAFVISAFVGPGFTRSGNAQRTVYGGLLGPALETNALAIPKFAKRAILFGGASDPADLTVATLRFWADAGKTACMGNFLFTGNAFQPCPVPNGAAYFSILSGMANANRVGVTFDLSI